MDKNKILFKRLVATVSAVAVFALSFSMLLFVPKNISVSSEQISFDDINNRSAYMVSPFYGLSLYVVQGNDSSILGDEYFDGFALPKFLTNYTNEMMNPSGEYLGVSFRDGYTLEYRDYYYGNTNNLHRVYLNIAKPTITIGYSDSIYLRGDNFTISPTYLALLFGSYISNTFDNTDGVSLGFKFNGDTPDYIDFTLNIVLQSQVDPFYDLSLAFQQQDLRFRIFPNGDGWFWFKNAYLSTSQPDYNLNTSLSDFYLANFLNDKANHQYLLYDNFYRCRVFDLKIIIPPTNYTSLTAEFLDLSVNSSLGNGFSNIMNFNSVNSDQIFKVDYNHWYDYDRVFDLGYAQGFNGNFNVFGSIFSSVEKFLAIEIFPDFTISSVFFLVFGLSFLFFVLKVFLGG